MVDHQWVQLEAYPAQVHAVLQTARVLVAAHMVHRHVQALVVAHVVRRHALALVACHPNPLVTVLLNHTVAKIKDVCLVAEINKKIKKIFIFKPSSLSVLNSLSF